MIRLTILINLLLLSSTISAQCNTGDATSCLCEDGSDTCDLLPDITVSWYALVNYLSGPNEYSQTGNGANNGRLKFTASTPNIGYGSFTVRGSDYFVCGGDTILGDPGVCPDGSAPKELIVQRIYHKSGNGMSYYDVWAGAMTYHPTHGHNHVDDWGIFTLRLEDPNDPNPLNWPIIGDGAKLGFCLMDYGTCSYYNGHCKDTNMYYSQGNTLINSDFPNYGLGGGAYNCSVVEQGISSGYTDIYSENLDGMWINIPPGTCNGNYWIVAEVDPKNNFIESREDNNWTAIPITLTLQDAPGNPNFMITSDVTSSLCSGEPVTLTAPGGLDYIWNTGDTTQSITVNSSGSYIVTLTNHCGTAASDPFVLNYVSTPSAPVITCDSTICDGMSAVLSASGSNIIWCDDLGFQVGTGNSFTSPSLSSDKTYYASDINISTGVTSYTGLTDTSGASGGYFNGDQALIFDTYIPITLKSVKVYANGAGLRTVQLLDQAGNLLQSETAMVPDGESRVDLNFDLPIGSGYRLRVPANSNLYRSNSGVNYPYEIIDTIGVISSTAGAGFYYYFYDWEIESGVATCEGPMSSQTIHVYDCTGIDEVDLGDKLFVYPNPNTGTMTITFSIPGSAAFDYEILDVLGKVVHKKHISKKTGLYQENIDLSYVEPSIYVLRILIEGRVVTRTFIVNPS